MQDVQVPIAELFRRLQTSDKRAFSELFEHFKEPLLRYAQRFTHDGEASCDILQDVFMKVWEQRETLAVQSSVQALLYTMVRNRALNMKRRDKWYDRSKNVHEFERADLSRARPDHEVDAVQLRDKLEKWIRDMPHRRGEAFMLSRYHGLSHGEIGAIMGVSERTVDTHILLALRELRAQMDSLNS